MLIPIIGGLGLAGLTYLMTKKDEPAPSLSSGPALPPSSPQAAQIPGIPASIPQIPLPGLPPTGARIMSPELKAKLDQARLRANDPQNDTSNVYRQDTLRYLSAVASELAMAGWVNESKELFAKGTAIAARPPPFVPGVLPPNVPMPSLPNIAPPGPSPLPLPPFPTNLLPLPAPVEPSSQTGTILGQPGANMRSGPSTTATIVEGLVNGTRVKVLSQNSTPTTGAPQGWSNVVAPSGKTGFVSTQYVSIDGGMPAPAPAPTPSLPGLLPAVLPTLPSLMATVAASSQPGINLRERPDAASRLIVGLFNGTKVKVLNPIPAPPSAGAPKGWFNIQTQSGQTGWGTVEGLRLDLTTPSVTGERMFSPGREGNLRRRSAIQG